MKKYNIEEILNRTTLIQGWFEKGDQIFINQLLSQINSPLNFLELGSWKGKSTTCIALSLPENSILTCVDTFNGSENEISTSHKEATLSDDIIYDEFKKNIKEIEVLRPDLSIYVYREKTEEAYKKFNNLEFDIIFIDGNHTFEYIKRDFVNYFPLCKENKGILIGHDLHNGCPGIVKFVKIFLPSQKLLMHEGSSLWCIKKSDVDKDIFEQLKRGVENE